MATYHAREILRVTGLEIHLDIDGQTAATFSAAARTLYGAAVAAILQDGGRVRFTAVDGSETLITAAGEFPA